tara:strand:- start:422 stop:709 length:288 start_codon:yes stop_codon:yes gene_type:complete
MARGNLGGRGKLQRSQDGEDKSHATFLSHAHREHKALGIAQTLGALDDETMITHAQKFTPIGASKLPPLSRYALCVAHSEVNAMDQIQFDHKPSK